MLKVNLDTIFVEKLRNWIRLHNIDSRKLKRTNCCTKTKFMELQFPQNYCKKICYLLDFYILVAVDILYSVYDSHKITTIQF